MQSYKNNLQQFWAEKLGWCVRPLHDYERPVRHLTGEVDKSITHALVNSEGHMICVGIPDQLDWTLTNHYAPKYGESLDAARLVVEEMGKRGYWLRLTSPFEPNFEAETERQKAWEQTRDHWWASFDFHGTPDTHPLWQASDPNPATAICLAAKLALEAADEK